MARGVRLLSPSDTDDVARESGFMDAVVTAIATQSDADDELALLFEVAASVPHREWLEGLYDRRVVAMACAAAQRRDAVAVRATACGMLHQVIATDDALRRGGCAAGAVHTATLLLTRHAAHARARVVACRVLVEACRCPPAETTWDRDGVSVPCLPAMHAACVAVRDVATLHDDGDVRAAVEKVARRVAELEAVGGGGTGVVTAPGGEHVAADPATPRRVDGATATPDGASPGGFLARLFGGR
jgi:hypothetical protein